MTSVAVAPIAADHVLDALRAAGIEPSPLGPETRGLIFTGDMHSPDGAAGGLAAVVASAPALHWIQLPTAGVDMLWDLGIDFDGITVTSAKGAFARPVAEHALTLTLAGLRLLNERIPARSWGRSAGTTLHGADVTIIGGGGIATEFIRLMQPFDTAITVVRRSAAPVPGAIRTLPPERVREAIAQAQAVIVAAPLTEDTRGMFAAAEFAAMRQDAWLVNVARGGIVVTDALVEALSTGTIAGAAIDVTEPEPLPDGHPLWALDNCIITPHTADTQAMIRPLLANRITENAKRFLAGDALVGVVSLTSHY